MVQYGVNIEGHQIITHGTGVAKGDRVQSRGNAERTGEVFAFSKCMLESCTGVRCWVRWPDGKVTKPCSKGLEQLGANLWAIK